MRTSSKTISIRLDGGLVRAGRPGAGAKRIRFESKFGLERPAECFLALEAIHV